jgi:hypothetical protein
MTAPPLTSLLRRAGDWLVEPPEGSADPPVSVAAPSCACARPGDLVPPCSHPVIGVVGLARRCGATTLARALAAELASRRGGAAVVASPERPAVVALGSSPPAARLVDQLPQLEDRRAAGRLCLVSCPDASRLAAATRRVAPAVMEVEPGSPALDAAAVLDRILLVASPELEPPLAAAVAETIAAVAQPPLVVVSRALDHGPWLMRADVLVPESRLGARMALAGREPRGWLGRSIAQLADLCAG